MDLILIGDGPTASAAAITAADAGLSVCMITRGKGQPLQGDEALQSIHPGLETLLAAFGAEKAIPYASRGHYQGIMSGNHWTPLSTVEGEVWTGHHISREAFDRYLLFCVRQRNIELISDDLPMSISTDYLALRSGRKLYTRYLIDGSGRSKFAGKKLKISETFFSPPLTAWSGVAKELPENIAGGLHTSFIPEKFGWTWLAPHLGNDCTWTRLARTRETSLAEPQVLSNAATHSPVTSANVRWRLFDQLTFGNVLLAGEAAGLIDPGAGQGILRACWSGINAARTVIDIINNSKPVNMAFRDYEDWFRNYYHHSAEQLKKYYQNMGIVF